MEKYKNNQLELNLESLKTELKQYENSPYKCLFEYIWNSFDSNAKTIKINFKLPSSGIGTVDAISIEDDGDGWDFEKEKNTKIFLSSTKQYENKKNKSLPRGKYGRGRYVFIWITDYIEIFSAGQRLELKQDTNVNPIKDNSFKTNGTKIIFHNPIQKFENIFFNENNKLEIELILEFGWLLKQNNNLNIFLNDRKIEVNKNIKKQEILKKEDFSNEIKEKLNDDFSVEVVLWKDQPSEWSNFYFLNNQRNETFKISTGLNKKSDNFWHSVYIISDMFSDLDIKDEESLNKELDFGDKSKKKLINKLIKEIKEKLIKDRKPYLIERSKEVIQSLEEDNLLPNLAEYGIYDKQSYNDLLKTIYTISPSLFTARNNNEKKFICATFAGLLSTQDNNLIKIILEQLQELTAEEKEDLLDILQRTTLNNIVKTIKEIDHRLQIINNLETLLFEYKNKTLEVKHLQKVLNENFWIFGEQFRLFSDTEGALKNTLFKYAKDILQIENPEIITPSRLELDLFLVKTFNETEKKQSNIIIEIKRPSIKLGKEEYDQLEKYYEKIKNEPICNGDNQYWEFYLIGDEYDGHIQDKIKNSKFHGEENKGLVFNPSEGKYKIYVRKWADILEVEWKYKMNFLKNNLAIQAQSIKYKNPDEIVKNCCSKKDNLTCHK